jgi:hypothetical protein
MERSLLEVFDDDFLRELKEARRHPDAFWRTSVKWIEQHGFAPFESYDSFRKKKSRKMKRK